MNAPQSGLLAEARRLDAEAIRVGEKGLRGRELRAQAAALRVAYVGPRSYPVVVCAACFRLTGWTTAAGSCDACARHAALRASEAAEPGWVRAAEPERPRAPAAPALPLRARLAARAGRRGGLERALAASWMAHVEPGETGPVAPEPGFELDSALRDEVERLDGAGVLVRFSVATHRFGPSGWERLASSRTGRSLLPNPAEFAAELAIVALVEAWSDYQQALAAINRARFATLAAAREAQRRGDLARAAALAEQLHTSEFLHEETG